jgi:hypothetical protein
VSDGGTSPEAYTETPKELGTYVYGLEDPRNGELFYVGRGVKDRCLHHARSKLDAPKPSDKLQRIRDIKKECGREPKIVILRYGLPNQASAAEVAAEVEAAVIDVLMRWKVPLTNVVRGAHVDRGLRSLEGLQHELRAEPLHLKQKAMLVNISRTWVDGMSPEDVWEAACCWWAASPEKQIPRPVFLLGVAAGIVRGAWKLPWNRLDETLLDRRIIQWNDLDPIRQAIYGDPANFKVGFRCRFVTGDVDTETQSFIGKHDKALRRSYGSPFRYLP